MDELTFVDKCEKINNTYLAECEKWVEGNFKKVNHNFLVMCEQTIGISEAYADDWRRNVFTKIGLYCYKTGKRPEYEDMFSRFKEMIQECVLKNVFGKDFYLG